MYRPGGLIDGAIEFYEWLVSTKTPHVFLSNTGAKGSPGVQTKFKSERYRLSSKPVPLRNIWTASEAQMDLMMHKKEDTPDSAKGSQRDYGLPHGAKVFVMAGGEGFWLNSLRMKDSMRFDSWDIRTTLTNDEAKAWAKEARDSQEAGECTVFVVLFLDGKLDKVDVVDGDVSGRSADYRGDWNYGLIRNVSFLLHHGAQLIYTADDAFNPSEDPEYPGMVFPLPGPGMFAAMMKFLMAPAEDEQTACAGKGGSHGDVFMFEHAIRMLKAQGHDGDLAKICMVGDRFDTDIRGGNSCGIKACLVQSGAHLASQQAKYPSDVADFTAASVGSMVPRSDDGAQADTAQAQRGSMAASSSNWQSVKDKVPFGARRSEGPRQSSTAS